MGSSLDQRKRAENLFELMDLQAPAWFLTLNSVKAWPDFFTGNMRFFSSHAACIWHIHVHMTHTRAYIQEELGPCPPPTGAEYPHPLSAMETKGARFLAKCSLISNERRYF